MQTRRESDEIDKKLFFYTFNRDAAGCVHELKKDK